ncbi:N-acetyllactosaminide 3-alpha-galactosyltransferase, partial [Cooperia oncophora]
HVVGTTLPGYPLQSRARNYCEHSQYLVIVVTRITEPSVRATFRDTYGRSEQNYNFTVVFPLGLSKDEMVNTDVREEYQLYGDILQTDFIDSYRNLTLKTYSYSNYVRHNCTNVRAVLKVDDDLAWNVGQMFDYLSKIDTVGYVLYCRSVENPLVNRDIRQRWYVQKHEYPCEHFPEYCLSPVYAATPSTISALVEATNKVPHLWLDDVWSLGIVAKKISASFQPLSFNVEREIFEPFLNGSVITQYFGPKEDGVMLFNSVNKHLIS